VRPARLQGEFKKRGNRADSLLRANLIWSQKRADMAARGFPRSNLKSTSARLASF
jgi:hypothetical protein